MTVLLYLSVILVACVSKGFAEFSSEDCWALGMNKANLLCSTCDQLGKHNLQFMREHCFSCCNRDEGINLIKRYPKASLEVCTCKFGAYPQIQAFVKGDKPKKFPNLLIRYVRGLDPIIKLMDENGNIQEVLAIERWTTDQIDEFLNSYLESDTDSSEYLKTNLI